MRGEENAKENRKESSNWPSKMLQMSQLTRGRGEVVAAVPPPAGEGLLNDDLSAAAVRRGEDSVDLNVHCGSTGTTGHAVHAALGTGGQPEAAAAAERGDAGLARALETPARYHHAVGSLGRRQRHCSSGDHAAVHRQLDAVDQRLQLPRSGGPRERRGHRRRLPDARSALQRSRQRQQRQYSNPRGHLAGCCAENRGKERQTDTENILNHVECVLS